MKKLINYLMATVVVLTTSCGNDDDDGVVEKVIPVTGVALDPTELIVSPGLRKVLKPIFTPENATNKAVTWTSNHEALEFDETTGEMCVLAITDDKITITVKTVDGGFEASRSVKIMDIPAIGVKLVEKDGEMILHGRPKALTAVVVPNAAANKNVTWRSNNEAVATVHPTTGVITAQSMGWATITVKTEDGGFEAECAVRVTSPNLLKNPGFEDPEGNAGALPSEWTTVPMAWFSSYYSDPGNRTQQDNANRIGPIADAGFFSTGNGAQLNPIRTGNWTGRIQADQTAGAFQIVNVTPGSFYWISIDIGFRRNNLNNHSIKTHESLKILSPDGSVLYYEVPIVTDPTQQFNNIWGVAGEFAVDAGITSVRYQIDQRSWAAPDGGTLTVFDECEFRELPPPLP